MGRYDSGTQYPKEFYQDNKSYGFLNPNKIQSGTLQGDVSVGASGPKLKASDNSIVVGSGGSQIIINAGGISIGGTAVVAGGGGVSGPYMTVMGPYSISATNGSLYSGDGVSLFTPTVGDFIINLFSYTTVAWSGGDGTGGALFLGVNFGIVANSVASHQSAAMFNPTVTSTTATGVPAAQAGFVEAGALNNAVKPATTISSQDLIPRGPWKVLSSAKDVCAKAVAPSGLASQFTTGQSTVWALVMVQVV